MRKGLRIGGWLVTVDQAYARELAITNVSDLKVDVVSVNSIWIEESLTPEWMAAFRLLNQDGTPVIGEIRIFPAEPEAHRPKGQWSAEYKGVRASAPRGGLTSTLLRRKLSVFRAVQAQTVEKLEEFSRRAPEFLKTIGFGLIPQTSGIVAKGTRGRPRLDDLYYAKLVAFYVERCKQRSTTPIQDIAAHFGIDPSVARNRLYKARKFGFLEGGSIGKAIGTLSPMAKKLLKKGGKHVQKER